MATDSQLYQDAWQPLERRVDDLLSRMTLDEKIAQLGSCWVYEILENFQFSTAKAGQLMSFGLGQITRLGGATNLQPQTAAELANVIQKYLKEETRLGIPAMIHEECCSGLMTRGATLFPQAIGVASTWDTKLTEAMTQAIGAQMRAIGGHQGLAPVLDVTRDPRWGRTEETFGEDPYLVASMGCAYVRGLQSQQVIATGKHFVGYGMTEGGMNWSPSMIPARQLHEVFLFPFEAAIKLAGLGSIMNSYSEIDGVPCCASRKLLTDILKTDWGFDGIVVSDYFAINMLYQYHKIARDKDEAAAQALHAGLDIELPSTDCFGAPVKTALAKGLFTQADLDAVLKRILRMKFNLGLFEHPYIDTGKTPQIFSNVAHRELSYQLAAESIVLLKNDGTLPLNADLSTIAVIGPNAQNWRSMIGDYAYPCHVESLMEMMHQENTFNMPVSEDLGDVSDALQVVTVCDALKQRVAPNAKVLFAQGCELTGTSKDGFAEAIAAAKQAQVAVVVVGDRAGLTQGCTSGESRDVAELKLPGVQSELIQAIHATGTPVVVVLIQGRPYPLSWEHEHVAAILTAWLPAEEGGSAIADVLLGKANPSGKLPISVPRAGGQIPVYYAHKPSGGRSHWTGNYVDLSPTPLYPFGHGLSYTTFAYQNLTLNATAIPQGGKIEIAFDVKNTGARTGAEVAQLYVHYQPSQSILTRPVKELKGFARVNLEAGATQRVTITLHAQQLAFYDEQMQYVLNPGEVEVMIGASADDIRLTGTFSISGTAPQVVTQKIFFSDVC